MGMPHPTRTVFLLALGLACGGSGQANQSGPDPDPDPGPGPGPGGSRQPTLQEVASGLDFPLYLTQPPDDTRLFIVEKIGTIRIVKEGRVLDEPFLDVSELVSSGSEQGLLSMAFHPGYAENGRFFIDYTDREGDTQVVEYRASADPDRADPAPVGTILQVAQPFSNHNGGLILFGPDGKLYVGLGDGGSGGDPQENGQSLGTLLGKILRIDVDSGSPYGIPPDNPFVDRQGARGEIWAWGLRNPWRFSFDRETGDLYVADVGQNEMEELNAVTGGGAGLNYGWDIMEGTDCFEPREGCDMSGLTLPVAEYDHGEGCSVTGGHVYRGEALPDLQGVYLYSDYCSGFIGSFRYAGGRATDERRLPELEPADPNVASFGEDAAGELYILTAGGSVFKIVPR